MDIKKLASYCLSCPNPSCEKGCPLHNRIRDAILAVKNDDFSQASLILAASNPFAKLTCELCDASKQCQGHCVLSLKGEPVHIQEIERFLAANSSWNLKTKNANGKSVAIIGAGVASLSAAKHLLSEGYQVDIFEKEESLGGAIYSGIPEHRFNKAPLKEIKKNLENIGISFHFGVSVGHDISFDDLLSRFDRILVATGAPNEHLQGLEGPKGYVGGLSFLRDVNLTKKTTQYEKCKKGIVWGGGNVALDCARSLKRLISDITILYRRDETSMPACKSEIEEAKKEGIKFLFLSSIKSLVTDENGSLKGINGVSMELGEPDASGRRKPIEKEDCSFTMDADLLIAAIGEAPNLSSIKDGLEASPLGETHKSSIDRVYLAGDALYGAKTVAQAIGDGKEAAKEIMESFKL